MREAEYRRAGLSRALAADKARRRFGNVTYLKEQTRDMWTFPSFESLSQDVRFGIVTRWQVWWVKNGETPGKGAAEPATAAEAAKGAAAAEAAGTAEAARG